VHRGALVVLGADGAPLLTAGDVARPVLPRSSNKPVQALAYLAAGWQPRDDRELAIAAASHNGEDGHVELVRSVLDAAGLGPEDLGCPPALPQHEATRAQWLGAGRSPERLAMNCSGKHAAMLAACAARGWPTEGYLDPEHPLQRGVRATLERLAGPVHAVTVDGCGAPAFATDLVAVARLGLALDAAPADTPEGRVAAAMRAHPGLVAGPDRLDTVLMTVLPGALSKVGAEGVLLAVLPDGASLALAVVDGAGRAVGPVLLEVLRRRGLDRTAELTSLAAPLVRGGGHPIGVHRVRS